MWQASSTIVEPARASRVGSVSGEAPEPREHALERRSAPAPRRATTGLRPSRSTGAAAVRRAASAARRASRRSRRRSLSATRCASRERHPGRRLQIHIRPRVHSARRRRDTRFSCNKHRRELHREFHLLSLPTRVVFGPGSIRSLAAEVERLGARRVLLISTPGRAQMVATSPGPRGRRGIRPGRHAHATGGGRGRAGGGEGR